MKLTNALLAVLATLAICLGLPGCGGGGGTGGGGTKPVLRSMNVGSSVLTVDARYEWQLNGYWTGDNVPDVPAMFDSLTGDPMMADVWLATDHMSAYVAPKVPSGQFNLSVTSTHPTNAVPPDTMAGQQETFSLPVGINPGNVSAPGNSLKMPEDGKVTLYVYSTTSRAAGGNDGVVSLIPPAPSRAQRLCPVRWTDSGGLGTFTPNPSTTSVASVYQLNRGALGTTTLVGTALDSAGNEMPGLKVTVTVNQIVPHPTLSVSGIADGDTISASRTVSVTTTNAAVTRWQLDNNAAADFVGQFTINPASLTEGQHTIKVSAFGELESVANIYSVTVTHPYDPGRPFTFSFGNTRINTNSDGSNKLVSQLQAFANGMVSTDQADTIRTFDSSMKVTAVSAPGGSQVTTAILGNMVFAPCAGQSVLKVYDYTTGALIDTVQTGAKFDHASVVAATGHILLAGNGGVRLYDTTAPYNYTTVTTTPVLAACGDTKYAWFYSDQLYRVPLTGGNPTALGAHGVVYDMIIPPGCNGILLSNISTKKVDVVAKDGTAIGSYALPDGGQVQAFGLNATGTGGQMPSNPNFYSYTWSVTLQ